MIELHLTQDQYQELQERVAHLRPLLEDIGNQLCIDAQAAFLNQGIGSDVWPASPTINVAGIVNDLQTSASVHDYNLKSRKALMASGSLFNSMNKDNLHFQGDSVELISDMSYSGLMNDGGISRQSITAAVKANLAQFIKKSPQYKDRLTFLFSKDELVTNVSPRNFTTITPDSMKKMTQMVEKRIAYGP